MVYIRKNAVAGGADKKHRGAQIAASKCETTKYKIIDIRNFGFGDEARLEGINTWVALASLYKSAVCVESKPAGSLKWKHVLSEYKLDIFAGVLKVEYKAEVVASGETPLSDNDIKVCTATFKSGGMHDEFKFKGLDFAIFWKNFGLKFSKESVSFSGKVNDFTIAADYNGKDVSITFKSSNKIGNNLSIEQEYKVTGNHLLGSCVMNAMATALAVAKAYTSLQNAFSNAYKSLKEAIRGVVDGMKQQNDLVLKILAGIITATMFAKVITEFLGWFLPLVLKTAAVVFTALAV